MRACLYESYYFFSFIPLFSQFLLCLFFFLLTFAISMNEFSVSSSLRSLFCLILFVPVLRNHNLTFLTINANQKHQRCSSRRPLLLLKSPGANKKNFNRTVNVIIIIFIVFFGSWYTKAHDQHYYINKSKDLLEKYFFSK